MYGAAPQSGGNGFCAHRSWPVHGQAPRNRKFPRSCMGRPVVFLRTCLQITTTSGGMIYHSGSFRESGLAPTHSKVRHGVQGILASTKTVMLHHDARHFLITAVSGLGNRS